MAEDLQPSSNPQRNNDPEPGLRKADSQLASGRAGARAKFAASVIFPALGMLILCLVVYYPLHAAGFIWDDGYWILNNPTMHHWRDLAVIWFNPMTFMQYYPLSVTAYFLQYQLWGTDALGYHVVSILLQVICALLLWRVLLRLRLRAAWLAAAIFAINPLVVESVAWVVEQKNLISGIWVLAAVWAWIRFTGLDRPDEVLESAEPVYDWKFYGIAVLFYFLAVCAKTFVCALPAAILVLTWWKLGRVTRKHLLAGIPWFVITAGAAWMAAWRERYGAGAHGKAYHFSVFQHLVIAGKDIWFYVRMLFWPHPILMVYPRWHVHGFTTLDILYPITAALVAVVCFALRKRCGRGLFAAVACYAIMISPSLGICYLCRHDHHVRGGSLFLSGLHQLNCAGDTGGSDGFGAPAIAWTNRSHAQHTAGRVRGRHRWLQKHIGRWSRSGRAAGARCGELFPMSELHSSH